MDQSASPHQREGVFYIVCARPLAVDETAVACQGHGLQAGAGAEFLEHPADMAPDGAVADPKPVGDVVVVEPRGHHLEHLMLAGCELLLELCLLSFSTPGFSLPGKQPRHR